MADKEDVLQAGDLTVSELTVGELTAASIAADHIAIVTWNGKTGADAKFGEKHLYSDSYRERWPQDQYPEKYEEDVPVD